MKKLLGIIMAVGIVSICFSQTANALLIDFEDVAVPSGSNNQILTADMVSRGFMFDFNADHAHIANGCYGVDNGSTFLAIDDFLGNNRTTMYEALAGDPFSLLSLDLSEWQKSDPRAAATMVMIIGNKIDGEVVAELITLDDIWDGGGPDVDFQLVSFDSTWVNLANVVFRGYGSSTGDDFFTLDNIEVTIGATTPPPVPEPATMLLLGSGLIGLVGYKKKSRKEKV